MVKKKRLQENKSKRTKQELCELVNYFRVHELDYLSYK